MRTIRVRRAGTSDQIATRRLVCDAFGAEGEETAGFLDALRSDGCILAEWLAEDATGPSGYIVFSRVWLEGLDSVKRNGAMLTPLAVRPDRQRCGIGLRLMAHSLADLEAAGEDLFFVIGHPTYYAKVGFRNASEAGVRSPWHGDPGFMARGRVCQGRIITPRVIELAH